jgi:hypothetical protein
MTCGLCKAPITLWDSWRLAPSGEYQAHSWCLGDVPWDNAADAELRRNLDKPRWVVAVWDCDRAMGGMEEGGWSYEEGRLEMSIEVESEELALELREVLDRHFPYTGQRGMYSRRGPDYSVRIHDRQEQYDLDDHFDVRMDMIDHYPVYRPRYE